MKKRVRRDKGVVEEQKRASSNPKQPSLVVQNSSVNEDGQGQKPEEKQVKPKKPSSAYNLFFKEMKSTIAQEVDFSNK